MLAYPARFDAQPEGTILVTFRDVPEAITQGDDPEDALSMAMDALETAMSFYVDAHKALPSPSEPADGERLVALSVTGQGKAALYATMLAAGVTRAELARRIGASFQQVRRLLDFNHASRIEEIERALAALGLQMNIAIVPKAA